MARFATFVLVFAGLSASSFPQEKTVRLRGEVVLRGDDGSERVPSSGSLELWLRRRMEWHRLELALDAGRFEVDVPLPFTWIDAGRIVIEGRDAWCQFGLDGEIPTSRARLVARFVEPFTLKVVDSRSGLDLKDLEIVEAEGQTHPPPRPGIGTIRADSPFEVPLWRREDYGETDLGHGWYGTRTYFVRAPSMVWTSITIDPSAGGSRTLALDPEARLRVRLVEGQVPTDVVVELRRNVHESNGARIAIAQGGQHVDLDGIAAGKYWVAAELLDRAKRGSPGGQTGRFLFLEQVDLAPSVVRELTITLRDRSEPIDAAGHVLAATNRLRGTLRVPAAWGQPSLALEFHRNEPSMRRYLRRAGATALKRDPADPELLHWDAGQVEAGSWVAVLSPIAWCSAFVIGSAANEPITLDLPPPEPVTVRIVDARTGSDIEPCTLAWHSTFPLPWSSVPGASIERDVRTKIWRFRAPRGEIVLKANTYRVYSTKFERVMIRAGENEITLRL
jgi:hypothetical protein